MKMGTVLLLVLATSLFACGGERHAATATSRRIVASEVPVAATCGIEPAERYPEGSRVVVLDAERPGDAPRVLSPDLAAAGGAAVDHAATKVAFVARRDAGGRFAVFTCDAEGGPPSVAAAHPTDCGGVALLPDGRLVYAAALDGKSPLPGERAWALFVSEGGGGPGTRITFGGGIDIDPCVLRDGRIAYTTYLPGDPGRFAVFTVHPDGTGVAPLLGERGEALERVRVTQADDGRLYLNAGDHACAAEWSDPRAAVNDLPAPVRAAHWVAGAPDGALLIADGAGLAWCASPATAGAPAARIAAPAGRRFASAVALAPRRRPQGHLSMVKPETRTGQLIALDARHASAPGAAAARLSRLAPGAGLARDRAEALGDVPLAADGSIFVRVPADTPLLLDLVSADGRVLVAGRTPFWVRPNESRTCVGCHEEPDSAPPNHRPLAVLADPVDLAPDSDAEGGR